MKCNAWKSLIAVSGAACLALGAAPAAARAGEPEVEDLKARLERLEKQNERLEKQNARLEKQTEYFQKVLESGGVQGASVEAMMGQNKAEMEKIIGDFLKNQESAAKAAAEKKAKELDAAGYEVGKDLSFRPRWNHGLYFESPYKDFKVHVGGRLQSDWWFFDQDPALKAAPNAGVGPLNDGHLFRRIRLGIDGTAWEILEWDVDIAFETGSFDTTTVLTPTGTATAVTGGSVNGGSSLFFQDAWMGLTQLPIIGNVRMGHVKVPMGLESLTSSKFLTFMERATIFETFFQEYDPAIVVFNNYCNDRGTWHAAFHRIDPQEDAIDFGDGDYAGTGRVTFLPWWQHNGRCMAHIGAAYQYRNCDDGVTPNTVRFRSRPEFRDNQDLVGNSNRWVNTGNVAATDVQTLALEGAMVWGPLSIQGEYVNARVHRAPTGEASYNGYYVQASYFITGEHRPYDRRIGRFSRVIPYENFFAVVAGEDGCGYCCAKGAWEVAARYSVVDLTDFVASDGIGGRLEDITLGVNWYINPNFTVQWNYVMAHRDKLVNGALAGDADALSMRFRLDF